MIGSGERRFLESLEDFGVLKKGHYFNLRLPNGYSSWLYGRMYLDCSIEAYAMLPIRYRGVESSPMIIRFLDVVFLENWGPFKKGWFQDVVEFDLFEGVVRSKHREYAHPNYVVSFTVNPMET